MYIQNVEFLDDYVIKLNMENHEVIYYDLKPQLKTARFKHIKTLEFFKQGKLMENCYISWDAVTELQDYEMLGEVYIKENI